MPQIDKLTERMTQRGIERMVIISDQPMRIFASGQEGTGPVVSIHQLQEMVREIAPAHLLPQIHDDGQFQFPYLSPTGLINIHVERQDGVFQIALSPLLDGTSSLPSASQPESPSATLSPATHTSSITPSTPLAPSAQEADTPQWHYMSNGKKRGPVNNAAIARLIASGHINNNTRVWREGMDDWIPVQVTELDALLPTVPNSAPLSSAKSSDPVEEGNGSGLGDHSSALPQEIQGFNWGASLIPVFWGAAHGTWVVLWCIVLGALNGLSAGLDPMSISAMRAIWTVGLIGFCIWLGVNGNEFAWRNRKWQNTDQFRHVQKQWTKWGVIVFLLSVVVGAITAPVIRENQRAASSFWAGETLYQNDGSVFGTVVTTEDDHLFEDGTVEPGVLIDYSPRIPGVKEWLPMRSAEKMNHD